MKTLGLALAAAFVCGLATTQVSAAPLSSAGTSKTVGAAVELHDVAAKKRGYKKRQWRSNRGFYGKRHYGKRRYYRGPAGWRRYNYRPYDYRTRGCIIVGPVWFCP